jgi:4'-phosphopantetheinyl transferase
MENWLSRAERSSLVALEPSFRAAAVALCWTRKEAVVKGLGLGLTDALADLECGVQPGVVVVEGWRVESVPVPAGHVATIATRTPQRTDIAPEGLDGRLDA